MKFEILANMTVSVDRSGTRAEVQMPALSFDDFDRTRNLSALKLQSKLTIARMFAYHYPNKETGKSFLEYDKMTKEVMTFMASTRTKIEKDYYHILSAEKIPSFAMSIYLSHVGHCSLSSVCELIDKESGRIFARNINQVVAVDRESRKPVPIPTWWKEKYTHAVVQDEKFVCPLLAVPEDKFEYRRTVVWSDIDGYMHTNYVSYLRFCLDAAMDGVVSNYFTQFQGDILKYHIKEYKVLYKGESQAGDNLNIVVWENKENPFLLHFNIFKEEKTIFQNSIEFYPPKSN